MAVVVSVDLRGEETIQRAMQHAPEVVEREIDTFVGEASALLEREVKERTPTTTGLLRASIFSRREVSANGVLGIVGTSRPYAAYVELGTRPHWAPLQPLVDWVTLKLSLSGREAVRVARMVQRKIARRGTRGKKMFAEAVTANEGSIQQMWRDLNVRIGERLFL